MKLIDTLYKIEEAEWVILGIPFEGKISAKSGCSKAPDAIRKAFRDYWTFNLDKKMDLADRKIVDIGNIKANSYEKIENEISKKITEIKKKNKSTKILFIGGDHSITPLITKTLGVKEYLCLDAHFDLNNKYKNDKNSHACANRRIVEQKILEKMHLRGIRSSSEEEYYFAEKNNKINWKKNIEFDRKVDYFSLDIDAIDPCFIKTGTPEMFGFSPEQVINTIRHTNFKYFDLVEWIPDKGHPYIVQIIKEVLWK